MLHWDGVRWYPMPNPTTKALRAVWGTSPTDVYAAGEEGQLFRFNGSTWIPLESNTSQILLGLTGLPEGNVFAVGGTATIVKASR